MDINNIDDLRLFSTYYVEACSNTNENKLKFLNFIKEADENQIIYLLTKGEMLSAENKQLNEINMNFDMTFMDGVKHLWGSGGVRGAANVGATLGKAYWPHALVVAAATYAATKIYKNYISKAAKACSSKKGEVKKICMNKFKMNARKQRIGNLQKGKSKCKKSKNPNKCVSQLDVKINRIKSRLTENTTFIDEDFTFDKEIAKVYIQNAHDLTEAEKFEALEGLDQLSGIVIVEVLTEARGDADVAKYLKHRNKIKKITGQKALKHKDYGLAKKKAVSAKGSAAKAYKGIIPKAKSIGAKIAAAIKAKIQVVKGVASAYAPKAAKVAKVAAKSL